MVSPEINIYGYWKTKEDLVTSVNDLLSKFVPEGISPWITITKQGKSGGSFVIHVTTVYSDT